MNMTGRLHPSRHLDWVKMFQGDHYGTHETGALLERSIAGPGFVHNSKDLRDQILILFHGKRW